MEIDEEEAFARQKLGSRNHSFPRLANDGWHLSSPFSTLRLSAADFFLPERRREIKSWLGS
jgi:hypothetical protein